MARSQSQAMAAARTARPDSAILTAPWQPLGPSSLASISYGNITGRITAIALDPNDATGNTVYLGTTGGGVWKSTNAAGALNSVAFAPLTDDLPVFSANAGSSVIPSISIGALAVQPRANPVLLAGTGDPNDATDSLYGEGLLRSTDGGLTWTVVQGSHDGANGNHSFIGLGTAGIAFSTATPSLVVAAFSTSADGVLTGASNTATAGLYYSNDAGLTWQMASVYDGVQVVQQPTPYTGSQPGNAATSVVWDAQRAIFVAAVRYHGYYSSADGVTWTRLASQPGTGLSAVHCPSVTTSTACPIFRGTLAVQPLTGDLYALTVAANAGDQGLWQDLCRLTSGVCSTPAPSFPTRLDNGALEVGSGNTTIAQGTYNLTLAAAPASSGETELYAGTIDLYRCTLAYNGGVCIWRNTTNAVNGCAAPAKVAPAQHALAALSQASGSPLLFLGNDSGLWRSLDGVAETEAACSATDASHFDNLNAAIGAGGSLAEIVGLAQHPSDANTLLAGMGQNGSGATSAAGGLAAWPQLSAGEGGYPLIDPNAPTNWLLAIGAEVNFSLCAAGRSCTASNFVPPATVGEAQVSDDTAQLDAPALLDPGMSANLVTATCRVWRGAASGGSWSTSNALSRAFDGGATPCTASSALVRSIAVGGPVASSASAQWSGSKVMYAGMSGTLDGGASIGGHVFVTTAANTASSSSAWTDLKGSPVTNDSSGFNPAGFDISALAVDSHDATGATVYATVMGFGQPHVYQSTDFGAHWTNISANLPDAPANAVAIDPGDANTVYVALDTGVYVTTAVTTCATANCWSPLGTGLPNSPVTSLAAGTSLPTGDGRVGLLRVGTYGRGIWSTPLLTAAAPVAAGITVSPLSLMFSATAINTNSASQIVTVSSSGNSPLAMGTLTISGNFAITADTCSGVTLAAGTSCTVGVAFAPVVLGPATGALSIPSTANATVAIPLSGSGVHAPTDTLSPASLTFASQQTGTTSAAQSITLTNSGDLPLGLISITSSSSQFAESDTCGSSLAAQSSCTISMTFAPTASGPVTGSLTVTDTLRSQVVSLNGAGYLAPTDTLSANSVAFGTQLVGSASSPHNVTLTNSGDLPLTITSLASSSTEFPQSNTCGSSLAAHSACTISVSFTPASAGNHTGSINLVDANGTQTIALTGLSVTAAGVTLTPASLSFSSVLLGTTSAAQTVTVSNNGGSVLNVSSAVTSANFGVASSTCGTTLAAGASCTYSLTFAPPAAGPYSGSFTLTDNAPNSPQVVSLSGTGTMPATLLVSPASLYFPSTTTGAISTAQVVTLSNTGGLPVTLSSVSTNAGFTVSSNTCGATLSAGASCAVGIIFTPTAAGSVTGTLTIGNSATPSTQTVALSGTGLAPATDTLAPLSLSFGSQATGVTSAAQTVTLTNSGDTALSVTGVSSSNPSFLVTNGCGATLAAHSACTLSVTFSSTTSGTSTGTLSVSDTGHTQTVSLMGATYDPATDTLSTLTLGFGSQAVGSTSNSQPVTLTNTGQVALSITSITTSSAEFGATGTCGSSLAAHSSCTINVTFTPTGSGARSGSMTVSDAIHTQTVSLTGTGYLGATDTLSAASLSFSSQQVNTASAAQSVTLSNSGDVPLTISSLASSSPEFPLTTSCGASLAARTSCTLAITFMPSAMGSRSGTITLVDSTHTEAIALTGTGVSAASIVLTPTSLVFPATIVNQTSASQVITLSNTGGQSATLQTPAVSGDFAIANNTCGGQLAPGTGCSIAITFTPTGSGLRNGTLSVGSSAGSQTAALSGTGNAPATDTLTPLALTFATQPIGTTSAGQQVTLTNSGDTALTLISTFTSTVEFGAVNACGTSLAAHSTCAIVVTFTPTTTGTRTGLLTINDAFRTQTVVLNGTAVAPQGVSLSPSMLSFAPTGVGLTSTPLALVLTNNGGLPLNIASVGVSAGFALVTNGCGTSGTTLAAGANCTIQVVSTPGSAGPYAGTLTMVTNATPAVQTVTLSGTGIDFTLAATGATSQTVSSGGTATYALQLSSLSSLSGSVALSCTGAPADSHCIVTPGTGTLGGTQGLTVTVTTGVAALMPGPVMPWMRRSIPVLFALTAPLLWMRRKKRNLAGLTLVMLLSLAGASISGCGAGRTLPPGATTTNPNPTPTPNGSYTLTVTGMASGVSHAVQLTLIVQ